MTVIGFLKHFGLDKDYKVSIFGDKLIICHLNRSDRVRVNYKVYKV